MFSLDQVLTKIEQITDSGMSTQEALRLKIHINNLAILVDGSPEIMLLAINFDEDFIDEEGVAIATVSSLQSAGIDSSELDTPEADSFSRYSDAPLRQ